ncbi:hypothetical protein N7532_006064 [Penicillium argentinense]|uniref:GPI anchored serine-threonine rich protein n=1 Tax=Penicillium argentinense TaxID=1131581 RepID=A0A9W9FF34_9EURO|nr:uncharacterized protein N7532_006064 [Penicillium argentinense]KAJ5099063.1 hypothetical protein N7532_006064 [Penicillium argentinense]
MHPLTTFLLLTSSIIISAQDTTTTGGTTSATSKCAAQDVVNQCILTENFTLESCAPADWDCLCAGSKNVVDCYNNCPDHPNRASAQQVRAQNCENARVYGSATSVPSSTTTISSTSSSVEPTATSSKDEDEVDGHNEGIVQGRPTQSLSGLEANNDSEDSRTSRGVRVGPGWVGVLGIVVGFLI